MSRMELPITPGDYNIDGVSIIVLPTKIIVDTGNRQTAATHSQKNKSASAQPERKKEKKESAINSILDSCQEFVMPGSTKRR